MVSDHALASEPTQIKRLKRLLYSEADSYVYDRREYATNVRDDRYICMSMRPKRPSASPLGPAAKNNVFVGWLSSPLPNAIPHRPCSTITVPSFLFSVPTNLPLEGSKGLCAPSPKWPIRPPPLKGPKWPGAGATPPAAFRGPADAKC